MLARLRPRGNWAVTGLENRSEGVAIDRTRQASRDPYGDAAIGKWGGQGAVPIFASGEVRLQGHKTPLDGRRLRFDLNAQVVMIAKDVVARDRLRDLEKVGIAGESSQILGIGPQGVVSDAALIAAGVDEGSVFEAGHAELLKWCSGSSAQAIDRFEIDALQ